MSFSVGDHVVYPAHGPGIVVDIVKKKDVSTADAGPSRFYVLYFEDERLTIHVPFGYASKSGLRPMMGESKCREVMQFLRGAPEPLPDDSKERRGLVETWLQSGSPLGWARVVRNLSARRASDRLNNADRDLLAKAQGRLVAEMATVEAISPTQMMDQMMAALEEGQPSAQH